MNYNHLNKIQQYWKRDIFPYLIHQFHATSFDDYLRRFAFLPSGKWLRDLDKVKLARTVFFVEPKKFMKKYKDQCVVYNAPVKPEDGFQRIIYQLSPTLHVEAAIWIWIEHELVQSYLSTFVCYNDEVEYLKFIDEIYKMKKEGDTEEKPTKAGFAALASLDEEPA